MLKRLCWQGVRLDGSESLTPRSYIVVLNNTALRSILRPISGRKFMIVALISALTCMCAATNAGAQWTHVGSFPTAIGCGFFFDENHGFIGTGIRPAGGGGFINPGDPVSIYKTTDGGTTWQSTQVPQPMYGAVTSISMRDANIGYASIFSDGRFGKPAIWRTSDGGDTWVNDLMLNGEATSVYATSKAIVWTDWDNFIYGGSHNWGGLVSTDAGLSWTTRFRPRGNGLDFTDDNIGVMTQMNPSPASFWRTSDGGVTWIPTANAMEAWSVYGIKGTKTFFTANESQGGFPTTVINWSQDGGATWSLRYNFDTIATIAFTGTIRGALSTLYIQTDTGTLYPQSYYGMYRSDDLGLHWKPVGGPANSRDTRFVVADCKGSTVYAFDPFGNVYKTINGGDGTIPDGNPVDTRWSVDRDTLFLNAMSCSDSAEFSIASLACPIVHYDSTSILAASDVTLEASTFGVVMHTGDSIHVRVRFAPMDTGSSFGTLRVRCHTSDSTFEKEIALVLRSDIPEAITLTKDSLHLSQSGCTITPDTLSISSNSCSAMILDSVTFGDQSFSLGGQLPTNPNSGAILPLAVTYSSDTDGAHPSLMRVVGHMGNHRFDTSVTITGSTVLPKPQITLAHDTLFFPTAYCANTTDTLRFINPGCGSITIDSLDCALPFVASISSHTLGSKSGDSVAVLFSPLDSGAASGSMRIHLHLGFDTLSVPVTLVGYNRSDPNCMHLSVASIAMATSNCAPTSDSVTIYDQGCAQVVIDSVRASGEFSDSVLYTSAISGGDSTRLRIQFTPDSGSVRTALVHIYGHFGTTSFDSVIQLNATNTLPLSPMAISPDTLALVTDHCQPITIPLLLHNNLCGTIEIDSLRIARDSLFEFNCDTAGFGQLGSLHDGSVQVKFSPNARGLRSTELHVYCHSGSKYFDTVLSVSGDNITAPEPYIGPIASVKAGDTVAVPIMLLPTTDTFSISHVTFHMSFNTDLITAVGLTTINPSSPLASQSSFKSTPTGADIDAYFRNPIAQDSNLSIPIVSVLMRAFLTKDLSTTVTIDSFVTRVSGREHLCSIPDQQFTLALNCGDGTIEKTMAHEPLGLSIVSVNPNPAITNRTVLSYRSDVALTLPTVDLYDDLGNLVCSLHLPKSEAGDCSIAIPISQASGRYELVIHDEFGRRASRSVIIEH